MSFLQTWGLKIGLGVALMAGSAGAAWFAADAHYGAELAALRAADKQAVEDQAKQDAETLTRYAQAAQEIQNEASTQLASMSTDVADLGMRVKSAQGALRICSSADPVPIQFVPVSVGSRPSSGTSAPTDTTGPVEPVVPRISVDPVVFRDDLKIGIKAIDAELLYRELLRDGGQSKPGD
jgi:hypothetical protein